MTEIQAVDPDVSRSKFEREIERHRAQEAVYRAQGCFLLDAEFPDAFVVFAAAKMKPPVLPAAVVVNFSNYDLRPPSVTFVDPFTRQPVARKDLPFRMLRRPAMPGATPDTVAMLVQQGSVLLSDMLQANGPEDPPFLCLPGIREYHDNPAHTGDAWLLHRGSGAGSLAFILDKILKYGTNPLDQLAFQVQVQVIGAQASPHAIPE